MGRIGEGLLQNLKSGHILGQLYLMEHSFRATSLPHHLLKKDLAIMKVDSTYIAFTMCQRVLSFSYNN